LRFENCAKIKPKTDMKQAKITPKKRAGYAKKSKIF
jgi:hypothetical protein